MTGENGQELSKIIIETIRDKTCLLLQSDYIAIKEVKGDSQ